MSLPRSSGVFTKDLSEKEISTPEVEPLHKEEERSGRDALQSKVCPTIKKGHRLVSEKFPENQAVPYKEYGQNTNSSTSARPGPDHRKTFMPVESTPNVLPIENKISSTQAKCISHCGMKYQRASFTCYSINKSRQSKAVIECCSPDMLEDRFEQRKSDGFSNDGHFDVSARLGETFKIVMQGNFDQKADITFSKIFQEVEFPVKDFARNCVTIIVYKKDKHALQRFSIDRRNDVLEFKGNAILDRVFLSVKRKEYSLSYLFCKTLLGVLLTRQLQLSHTKSKIKLYIMGTFYVRNDSRFFLVLIRKYT
ncbi:hypothetical protein MAR_035587 [Mya arenaria]|uniref:Uncharacterized protein n=1 Tax=Mya arenaria TaxID=6604 RepID=A0ABY7ETJ4_MYAAR|nr:hypothetical protein MAR_035587 [Mya arenaria]